MSKRIPKLPQSKVKIKNNHSENLIVNEITAQMNA